MYLKDTVGAILRGQPSRKAIQTFVQESHRYSLAYLRKKARQGSLEAHHFGLSLEDLALDFLADLFERDEEGHFVQIKTYFEGIGWQNKDEAGLHIALRRLVFSKVNDGLFRGHRRQDPELARIIRNVKNAVKGSEGLTLMRRGKELWMVAGDPDALGTHPTLPSELLESRLMPHIAPDSRTPDIVSAFKRVVESDSEYTSGYPVSRFALAVRSAHVRMAAAVESEAGVQLVPDEVEQAIQYVTEHIREAAHDSYVMSGKMDEATFEAYLQAMRDALGAQFCSKASPLASHYEALKQYMPALTKEQYRSTNRHVLEYLIKMGRTQLIDYFKVEASRG